MSAADQVPTEFQPRVVRRARPIRSLKAGDDMPPLDVVSSASEPIAAKKVRTRLLPKLEVPSSAAPTSAPEPAGKYLPPFTVVQAQAAETSSASGQIGACLTPRHALSDRIADLKHLARQRRDFLQAEGNLARQINSIVRRMLGRGKTEKVTPAEIKKHAPSALLDMLAVPAKAKRAIEREIVKRVEAMPPWREWGAGVRGFGPLSFAALIGECGDPRDFGNPAKLWKFMGVGLVDGERQRKCADAAKAIRHGYNPRRRSILYVIGDNLVRQGDEYRKLYDERKVYEATKTAIDGSALKPIVIHRRAKRYIEKRLLREFWRAWRDHGVNETQCSSVPAPAELD